jgi:signal transduction histidine kinase
MPPPLAWCTLACGHTQVRGIAYPLRGSDALAHTDGIAVTSPDCIGAGNPDAPTSQLLEQLMRVARTSALEEMASGFAHEINQPIGAIATFAQAAERLLTRPDPPLEALREILQHISIEALNAGHGIRRIRSLFDRSGAARIRCQIADVLFELQPVLELLATRQGAALAMNIENDLPPLSIDRLRIQHVMFALVQNALEAPLRTGCAPRVEVDVDGDRYSVQVAVTDSSSGMPPEVREHLFRPFFTTKSNGTGLGLASSRAIVEAHEGKIGFDEAPGGGTRFWFTLPAAASGAGMS